MANELFGENTMAKALAQIKSASGSAAKPIEAINIARKELIKAKVQLENVEMRIQFSLIWITPKLIVIYITSLTEIYLNNRNPKN